MHDPWIEKVSDSLDGLLSDDEQNILDEHLAGCAECRAIADDLRAVVAAAHTVPPIEPARDLWPDIAARLDAPARTAPPRDAAQIASLSPITVRAARKRARRLSFSAPQLAAAAVMLMMLSGATVWLLSGRATVQATASGTIIQSSGAAPGSARMVAAATRPAAGYDDDVAVLEAALEASRSSLDPATVEIIERSLESIDRAIEDARTALEADPGNPYLHRQLDNTMRKKIDVLQRATGARRAQS